MSVAEALKCQCQIPEPIGPFLYGAFQKCSKCNKIANWRQFEEVIE